MKPKRIGMGLLGLTLLLACIAGVQWWLVRSRVLAARQELRVSVVKLRVALKAGLTRSELQELRKGIDLAFAMHPDELKSVRGSVGCLGYWIQDTDYFWQLEIMGLETPLRALKYQTFASDLDDPGAVASDGSNLRGPRYYRKKGFQVIDHECEFIQQSTESRWVPVFPPGRPKAAPANP